MTPKTQVYQDLNDQLRALLTDEHDMIANAANLASLLYHGLPDLNWAGFYFRRTADSFSDRFRARLPARELPWATNATRAFAIVS